MTGFFALFLMLFLRYGKHNFYNQLNNHLPPFSIIIALFLLSFFIFNLYSVRYNRNITEFTNSFIKGICIAFFISISIFYIFGDFFNLTPKTNLIIFTLIFSLVNFYLRIIIKRYFIKKKIYRKIFIINKNKNELIDELKKNQSIGYEIVKETNKFNIEEIINTKPDLVVFDSANDEELENIYILLKNDIKILMINNFYEEIFQKIPIEKMEKEKIVEYISKNEASFNIIKRIIDIIISLILIIILFPILIVISLLIKLTSKGPIFIKQNRVSKNGKTFILYKFRSMIALSKDGQAETNNAQWSIKNDPRVTKLGKILRKTHLDEIPQLINIFIGDISFVGPRPERPEFVGILEKEINYYDLRHSIKAGLTGWAQINYKYGSSIDDAKEKLKYDFYYIKNKNIFFDILIIMKTIAKIFSQ